MMLPSWGLMNDGDLALLQQPPLLCYRWTEKHSVCQKQKKGCVRIEGYTGKEREGSKDRNKESVRWSRGENKVRWRKGEKGEAAVSNASLQVPSAGVFINTSRERLADNLPLSIPFNPLKDLNVH